MNYLNVQTVLNKVFTMFNTSTVLRAKAVTWFSEVARDVLNQPREWRFLKEPVTLTIASNQITLPSTMSEIFNIQVGDYFFTPADQLTDEETFTIASTSLSLISGRTTGYKLSATNVITFYPAQTGTAVVNGEHTLTSDYPDTSADTMFPLEFENLFITGVRAKYYDFEKDGRYSKEEMKYAGEMSKVKALDNRRKEQASYTSQGYIRG